ncbi:MAG: YicC/YloC family endoribonuclease [Thermodesulfobacteriota bacterium]
MKSMTGFGKSEEESSLGMIVVEARSENHRFLDINFQIPDAISPIEPGLNEIVKEALIRGKARILVVVEGLKNRQSTIDIELAKESRKTLEKLKRELGLKEPSKLEHFLMVKELFSSEVKPAVSPKDYSRVKRALVKAIEKLDETRISEGKKLEKDLRQRIEKVKRLIEQIMDKRKNATTEFSDKLKERMTKLLNDIQIDENRLHQEIAFLVDRSDFTEEVVRLKAHIGKFKETMNQGGSIGRELDFLLQEMNREASTTAAKSKDVQISHIIIQLRSEIEKMREQVQNIE